MLVVVPDVQHAFLCRVLSDLLIQRRPVIAALFRIDLIIQLIQLRMVGMNPIEDPLLIVPTDCLLYTSDAADE